MGYAFLIYLLMIGAYNMQNKKPLVEKLIEFKKKHNYSLHVPGHKHGLLSSLPITLKEGLAFDVTELTGLDDLHSPDSVIAEAQKLLTTANRTKSSYFLVNGSTVGNLAMLYATCNNGDTIIVQRNCHKSIFNAINLIGVNPIYITPSWDTTTCTASGIDLVLIKEAHKNNKIKAVVLTTPNYYGVAATNLVDIINYCHMHEILVLVDEAHGAHFGITSSFPQSAIAYGADIIVQSAHKTLPAMTMGAYLHINSERISKKKIEMYLGMLQSSSPSYPIMASLDDARHFKATYTNEDFNYFNQKRLQFIASIKEIKGITLITPEDPLKILLRYKGVTGFRLQSELEEQKVYTELADNYQVLLILPLLKQGMSFEFEEIISSVTLACQQLEGCSKTELPIVTYHKGITKPRFSPIEMQGKPSYYVKINEAIGKVVAETLVPYPPGIPICLAGEVITTEIALALSTLLESGAYFQGNHQLNEKLICVMKEA